jgi:predicted DNA binding CopG/RHH family protein
MREEYDFSHAKRAAEIPHLMKLQAETAGKTRITMRVDNETLLAFKARARAAGGSYQNLMNAALADYLRGQTLVDVVRATIREELHPA